VSVLRYAESRHRAPTVPGVQENGSRGGNGAGQLRQFRTGGRLDAAKPRSRTCVVIPIDAIEEQHVEMDVEIQRRAKPLDEGNRAGMG
jgi:hypothetical protein